MVDTASPNPGTANSKSSSHITSAKSESSIVDLSSLDIRHLQKQRNASRTYRKVSVKSQQSGKSIPASGNGGGVAAFLSSERDEEEEGIYFSLTHKELQNLFIRRQHLPHTTYWPTVRDDLTSREISSLLLGQDAILRVDDPSYEPIIVMTKRGKGRRLKLRVAKIFQVTLRRTLTPLRRTAEQEKRDCR